MNKVFTTLGASNHVKEERQQHDYYATDPKAIDILLQHYSISGDIREPACGGGHLSKKLIEKGYNVRSTDLIYRGFGEGEVDFMQENKQWEGNIITNPPYGIAQKFTEKALSLVRDGDNVIMFLKLLFLEGKGRKKFLQENPIKKILVSSSRIACSKGGTFDEKHSSAICYCRFIREKGYRGDTIVELVN